MEANRNTFGQWRKSSYSYDIGACVEVLDTYAAALIRDTENREAGHLPFNRREWAGFLAAIR